MRCDCGVEAGDSIFVDIKYDGMLFKRVAKDTSICLACLIKRVGRDFEKHGRDYVSLERGEIKVDWPRFRLTCFDRIGDFGPEYGMTLVVFAQLGIFSLDGSGNYAFRPEFLNVRLRQERFFFTRLADIVQFAQVAFGGRPDEWQIIYMSAKELFTKKDVLAMRQS